MFRKWSKISIYHYCKLIFRILLLLLVLSDFIRCQINHVEYFSTDAHHLWIFAGIIWFIYIIEMLLRMFPSSIESMGCQKQFKKNCTGLALSKDKLTENTKDILVGRRSHGRLISFFVWILLNGSIGCLYFMNIFNEGILMLIAMTYSVCDIICILFFCPFQTWFMKNRCCVNCYIYNWDYAMMFTPLVFIPHIYTYTLLGVALLVALQWEYRLYRYPERFDRRLNESLSCKNCTEKLCRHKKQLQGFIIKIEKNASVDDNEILNALLGTHIQYDKDE